VERLIFMRFKDLQNGKEFTPAQFEQQDILKDDIIAQSLKDKINKYNFMKDLFSKTNG